ncbi:MAG: acetate--CoA ligase family protein [Candidatus Omnitrophica bacterium]|nr:acetate--CoA ligase family protein [Candidatus Omnitrophota bacterium]
MSSDCCCSSKAKSLKKVFSPDSVAIIGASAEPGKIGYQVLNNILKNDFKGKVYPVNRKATEIMGVKCYPSMLEIPGDVDFAVIAVPAPLVEGVMRECAKKNIKGAVVITSGFSEIGKKKEEDVLKEIADQHGIALLGPNTFGFVYTPSNLNASFGPQNVAPGKIAFISQSGALGISLMGWTMMEKIGMASVVSLGNKADIGEKELIEYFNDDPNVSVILIYMEGIKNGREFMTTKLKKPVVILKSGSSSRGAQAAASHTGSLAGSDKIYTAAFNQLGMIRARTFTQAFGAASALSMPLPKGSDAVIITNGGGIGVSATDECENAGIKMVDDHEWLEAKFRSTMPDFGSTKNPIDVTGGGGREGYQKAVRVALAEDRIHAVIVLYCETAVLDPVDVAKAVIEEYNAVKRNKPLVVTMVGGERSRQAIQILNEHQIPAMTEVLEAVSGLKALYTWQEISSRPKEVAVAPEIPAKALEIIEAIRKEGRTFLLEHESRKVLEICGVPMPKWGFARTADEAVKVAEATKMYPIAMKIASVDIIHKSDVGGVILNVKNAEELKAKFAQMMETVKKNAPKANLLGVNLCQMVDGLQCIVGMNKDPQFGPAVMFGLGGIFVEVLKDVSFRIVPFSEGEAQRLVGEIKARKLLDGYRGQGAHKASIIKTLMAVQKIAAHVKEVDINPLITNKDGSYAVDARIII